MSGKIPIKSIEQYLIAVEKEANEGIDREGSFSKMGFFYDGWLTLVKQMRHDLNHGQLTTRVPKWSKKL